MMYCCGCGITLDRKFDPLNSYFNYCSDCQKKMNVTFKVSLPTKPFKATIFNVLKDSDMIVESKGYFNIKARFFKEEDARKYSEGKGIGGGDLLIQEEHIIIYNSLEETLPVQEDIKAKALSKLTKEEIQVLGL